MPRIAKYLSAIFLLTYFGRHLVWKFLPLYFEIHIDSVLVIGVLMALPAAVPLLFDIPVGNLVQRVGERAVILLGMLFGLVPGALYLLATPIALAAGKAAEGLSKSFVWTGSWSLTLKAADDEVESTSISVFLLGTSLASIVGPAIGGYLIASYGYRLPLMFWVGSAGIGLLLFLGYVGPGRMREMPGSISDLFHRTTYADEWEDMHEYWAPIRLPLLLILGFSVLKSFFWLAVPLLLDAIGTDLPTMGLIFGLASLPYAFQFVFGEAADRYGSLPVTALLALAAVPFLVAMAAVTDTYVIGGLYLGASLVVAGMSPPIHALFDRGIPNEVEGELTGVLETAKHLGQTAGPLMAGAVTSYYGLDMAFVAAAAVAALLFGLTGTAALRLRR